MTRIMVVEPDGVGAVAPALAARNTDCGVVAVGSIERAQAELVDDTFDALVLDLTAYQEGWDLLRRLKSERSSVARFAVVAEATPDVRAGLSQLGVIDWLVKPIDVGQAALQIQAGLCESLSGTLHNVSLPSFLQLIEIERKTCSLSIQAQGRSGEMYVNRGELFDACAGELRGEEAALRIIAWLSGRVTVEHGCPIVERTITRPVSYLLMTAMQMRDERGKDTSLFEFGDEDPPFKRLHDSLLPLRQSLPPSPRVPSFAMQLAPIPALPVGGLVLAVVDAESGMVLTSQATSQTADAAAWAECAAAMVRLEYGMLSVATNQAELYELVVTTASCCELIKPLVRQPHCFALLVFDPAETNLVMARIDIERFIADYTR